MATIQVTYPGVYIEELPSGTHTITGVATSITAFIGRAVCGPINDPITIFGYGDYERLFGGLSANYPMSYSVQDFFLNGGSQALIVRLFEAPQAPATWDGDAARATATIQKALGDPTIASSDALVQTAQTLALGYSEQEPGNSVAQQFVAKVLDEANTAAQSTVTPKPRQSDVVKSIQTALAAFTPQTVTAPASKIDGSALLTVGGLQLKAANPGAWGNRLSAAVDTQGITADSALQYARYGIATSDLFNLTLTAVRPDGQPVVERYTSVSVKSGAPNAIDTVLQDASALALAVLPLPAVPPAAKSAGTGSGGYDSAGLDPEAFLGDQNAKTGLYALEKADLFNLLCIPPDTRPGDTDEYVYQTAVKYCQVRRAMLIIDPPAAWSGTFLQNPVLDPTSLGITGEVARNAAVYFPRVKKEDPQSDMQTYVFPASGIIAGVYAQTDLTRGVWKAPAGQDASLNGIKDLELSMTDAQNGSLNPVGINCLRNFPLIGPVVWGARTLRGSDQLADDYKYVPVRRLTLYIEESLYRGTKWAVFEPNDEALWSQLRLSIGGFMADLSRQGAFYGYQVLCDKTTTTQDDIDHGIVNVVVAFAPVKPAEFIVLQIQQMAGQTPA
jgi:phage tail sheath protein FI